VKGGQASRSLDFQNSIFSIIPLNIYLKLNSMGKRLSTHHPIFDLLFSKSKIYSLFTFKRILYCIMCFKMRLLLVYVSTDYLWGVVVDILFICLFLLCWVGIHCSFHKISYDISNISYFNSPPYHSPLSPSPLYPRTVSTRIIFGFFYFLFLFLYCLNFCFTESNLK
jgi:hypothetical protein